MIIFSVSSNPAFDGELDAQITMGCGIPATANPSECNPSEDLVTALLRAELQDETGTKCKLARDEVLIFVNLLRVRATRRRPA